MFARTGEWGFVVATLAITAFVSIMFVVQIRAVDDDSCAMLRLQTVGKTADVLIGQMLKDSAFVSVKDGESLAIDKAEIRKHAVLEKIEELHEVHAGKIVFRVILRDGTILCDSSRSKKETQPRPLAKITDSALLNKIIDTSESSIDGGRVQSTSTMFASGMRMSGLTGYILLVEIT